MGKLKKYKMKTHKSTAKRFRVTGSGKVLRTYAGKSHFRRRKTSRVKNRITSMREVHNSGQAKRVKRLAPYLRKYRQNPPA
jgi:large subunit ribosomal protein L35